MTLFEIRGLHLSLPDFNAKPLFGPAPRIEILKGLDLDIPAGQVTGIVGESGSGKSTLGRAMIRLLEPTRGTIRFDGTDITHLGPVDLAPFRRDLQMIFQDPMSSLNPRRRIGNIVAQPLRVAGLDAPMDRALAALDRVHLGRSFADRYPHQLSGGQRQRVGIARAIALGPRFILADEIVSGLDVSSQAHVLTLLKDLARDMQLTVAFISHDLSVIRHLCDEVMVLDHGEIVDHGPVQRVFDQPGSDVTRSLLAAIPLPELDDGWFDR